jgi:hypothetical protein
MKVEDPPMVDKKKAFPFTLPASAFILPSLLPRMQDPVMVSLQM